MSDDEEHRSPHVSHVTRVDDEGNGPAECMCHMWMRERPLPPCALAVVDRLVDSLVGRLIGSVVDGSVDWQVLLASVDWLHWFDWLNRLADLVG